MTYLYHEFNLKEIRLTWLRYVKKAGRLWPSPRHGKLAKNLTADMVMSMSNNTTEPRKERKKFRRPPVTEVAIALFFPYIMELKAQHVGIYWDTIKDRYPNCDQQFPVAIQLEPSPQPFAEAPGEIFPLPRFLFSGDDHPNLIQIQRSAFMLNWRKREDRDYPHFEQVEREFWLEFEKYKKFVQDIGGRFEAIIRCELNYVNVISPNSSFKSLPEISKVLPPLSGITGIDAATRKLAGMTASSTFKISETLVVECVTKTGQRSDTQEIAAVLELKASGVPSGLSLDGADAWYKAAHDAIHALFLDYTAPEVQNAVWEAI